MMNKIRVFTMKATVVWACQMKENDRGLMGTSLFNTSLPHENA